MTSCETCDAGMTPNSEKTACGKITLKLILLLYNTLAHNSMILISFPVALPYRD